MSEKIWEQKYNEVLEDLASAKKLIDTLEIRVGKAKSCKIEIGMVLVSKRFSAVNQGNSMYQVISLASETFRVLEVNSLSYKKYEKDIRYDSWGKSYTIQS